MHDARKPRAILDPIARSSEILFGLIMVLTFTGSMSVSESGHEATRQMLIGAIGCNLAWGVVDAVMHLMSNLTTRARGLRTLRRMRIEDAQAGHQEIADALPPIVSSVLDERDFENIRSRLIQLPEGAAHRYLTKDDWVEAVGIFLLVFLSTFPVVLPFVFVLDATMALRVSNMVAIAMLFICGYTLGRYAGVRAWLVGLSMVVVGLFLAGLTMALGG
jgi:VIT1/CCC1 family predicted Fe2+/Mn2+ transporter